jgi:hypothetical protein
MAIGPDGKVTTTGLMNNSAKIPEAPNMSAMKMAKGEPLPQDPTKPVNPFAPKPTGPVLPKDPEMIAKLESLSEEEKQQLDLVLSPSLSQILTKIVPEASDVISQFTSAEENVILPVSVVKNFARKKYPSNTEQESVQGFVTELSESQSDDNNNVPPENTEMANPNSMMAKDPNTNIDSETDLIDSGQAELV